MLLPHGMSQYSADKWHYTLPAEYFVLGGPWSSGAFLFILIFFPSLMILVYK